MKKSSKKVVGVEKPTITVGVDLGDRFSRYCVLSKEGELIERRALLELRKRLFADSLGAKRECA